MFRKTIKSLISLFMKFLNIVPNTILVIESHFPSGSNTKLIMNELSDEYIVDMIDINEILIRDNRIISYLKYIRNIIKVSKYNVVLCSNGFYKYNPKQILIDLWHGIPIKAMMYMESDINVYRPEGFNADYLITSSKLESSLMAACTHLQYTNHRILGSPRNDYLFKESSNLGTFEFIKDYKKVIIYVPTYRQGYLNRTEGQPSNNLFYFDTFNNEEFKKYLKSNNILLMIKYHPFEEEQKRNEESLKDNIFHLTNKELVGNSIDLYEVLPYTDLLITDYSSIYFDYLLLDKPIIFTPSDLEEYSRDRGLLLEPYDSWTPGAKCIDQETLQKEILKSLENLKYYKKERETIKNIFHKYQDGNSTKRVISLIHKIMEDK